MYHIADWHRFQHFKDRKPPWIKLYRDILDDMDWHMLDDSAAKALVMLWLIASEDGGNLPDIKTLSFRLRLDEKKVLSILSKLSKWVRQDDITEISEEYQVVSPSVSVSPSFSGKGGEGGKPETVSQQTWNDFISHRKAKKAPVTQSAINGIAREAEKAGVTLEIALQEICARGWTGFKAEWIKNENTRTNNSGHGQSGPGNAARRSQGAIAAEIGEQIIARREAQWAAEDAAKGGQGRAEEPNPAALPDLRSPEKIR